MQKLYIVHITEQLLLEDGLDMFVENGKIFTFRTNEHLLLRNVKLPFFRAILRSTDQLQICLMKPRNHMTVILSSKFLCSLLSKPKAFGQKRFYLE